MSNSSATQKVCPGPTEVTSLTSRALTFSVLTVLPVAAKAAGQAKSKANSENWSARIALCYRNTALHECRALKGCGPSHSLGRHTAGWPLQLSYLQMPLNQESYVDRILKAKVYDVAIETALEAAPRLSRRLNNHVWFKREDLQPGFSF